MAAVVLVPGLLATAAGAQDDPRLGLEPGLTDAEEASSNLELLAHRDKAFPGTAFAVVNSDLAFGGDYAYVGNWSGLQIYDISDPADPRLTTVVNCHGGGAGQHDVTLHGNLLFVSVEGVGRVDCSNDSSVLPFRGVRIFDVSDVTSPVQVAAVQTCRGSHTHTLVTDPADDSTVYIYNSGTAGTRSSTDPALPGCTNPDARFQVEVIEVPLAAPQDAAVVNRARLFTDPETGAHDGLWPGGNHGPGTQTTTATDACHDITSFPAIGLAAGACEGNGILIDISDPANPVRVDEVIDPNFAYWHSATFNNDGTKVIFTDEWGGGSGARCRAGDPENWGANAIFDIVEGKMEFRSHYKLPVTQTSQENCVAHNGSLVPVPDRDIMVQAWYQGGISVLDFTDSADPHEIAFFDRGPVSGAGLVLGGFWSAYHHNGHIFGTEIARGFDTFALTASPHLSQAALDVAATVQLDEFNPQHQPMVSWPASFPMADYRLEQVVASGTLKANKAANVQKMVDKAEAFLASGKTAPAKAQLQAAGNQLDRNVPSQEVLYQALHDLRATIP